MSLQKEGCCVCVPEEKGSLELVKSMQRALVFVHLCWGH